MEEKTPSGQPIVDREKTAPFLIRAFVKVGSFHRLTQFQDGLLPIVDELQIFTWKDATLFELLTTIRNSAPSTLEYRHPLARYSFRTIYADAGNRGQFAQKDLGTVYSRDTLGDLGTVEQLLDDDSAAQDSSDRQKDARTLDELRFVPGDYLCVAVMLPKNVQVNFSADPSAPKSAGGAPSSAPANGWKSSGGGPGRGANAQPSGGPGGSGPGLGLGRGGGGHWRGGSDAPPQSARGRGDFGAGRGERGRERDRDAGRFRDERDRRPPPPRRESPPLRVPWGDRDRAPGYRRSPSRSRSRSRSPPPRRRK
ncbi:histone deacetylase complex protein [Russula earlei]|uniref:Histone deacetylase complex protein n=1 Tax=Russula earlei TaxID=71964 RepID=A0ACC0U3S9_9AGAM|nr:histone deacetylase complex protein [Russula earlei]